jgi:branched-chain amino acid transport system ATP-binding protein
MLGTHIVTLGAVMVPEGRRVFKHLTVEENIRVGSITRKDGSQKIKADHRNMYTIFLGWPRSPTAWPATAAAGSSR